MSSVGTSEVQGPGTEVAAPAPRAAVDTVADRARELAGMQAGSATELLRIALERNVPVDALKELVGLHELMEKRDARKAFAAALRSFQRECPPIKKNATAKIATSGGGEYEYTYAELDYIARTIAPLLDKHGLSYGWDSKTEAGILTCTCTLRHDAGHSETSTFVLPTESRSGMSAQQKVGAAWTFAQRRTLCAVLGITTADDDTDAGDEDPTAVSDDQATQIDDLITESGSSRARFLKYMGVEKVADIPARRYAEAVKLLQRAVSRKAEKATGGGE